MTHAIRNEYDSEFFEVHAQGSAASAAVVVPLVNEIVQPKSVLDVGCGVGTWLAEWARQGVTDLLGIDGAYAKAQLQIDPSRFIAADLEQPFTLGRRFDVVECLEVAEHLDASCADVLVECLCAHADIVLFSAAIPCQGGTHHVNEQWPSYWIPKFAQAGFSAYDVIRPRVWTDNRVQPWYRQNALLFSRTRAFSPAGPIMDVVHPEFWEGRSPSLRQLMRELPTAARRAARNRLGGTALNFRDV